MEAIPDKPIVIPPDLSARIASTQAKQAKDDQIGLTAAGTVLPGALREVFCEVPDIKVGPYNVRRFTDRDFIRLAKLGHPLNSFAAMQSWTESPTISGPEAYNIIWLMTRSIQTAKTDIDSDVAKVKADADNEFGELAGFELASLVRAIAFQLSRYMGARLDYESLPVEGQPSPPR